MAALERQYREARDIIERARMEIDDILTNQPGTSGEENLEAYYTLENLTERLGRTREYLDYLSMPVKEGILREDGSRGKFYIEYDDGEKSYLLSCGNSLELYLEDEWIISSIEARDGKYYFNNGDKPFLRAGTRARKRVSEE